MTRQLLNALMPSRRRVSDVEGIQAGYNDDYQSATRMQEDPEQIDPKFEMLDNVFANPVYPRNLSHLLEILIKTDDKRVLSLSNPDGYFYLFYLRCLIKLFTIIFVLFGAPMMYIYYVTSTNKIAREKHNLDLSTLQLVSMPINLFDEQIYYIALGLSFIIAFVSYWILLGFCNEMS